MKNKKEEVNVLDELNKGACMGRDAIHFILDKVTELRGQLDNENEEIWATQSHAL